MNKLFDYEKIFMGVTATKYKGHPEKILKMDSRLSSLIKAIPKRRGKMLDIGCGTGQLISHLAKQLPNAKLYGIDLTEAMINRAKQKLKQYKNITLQQASVENIPHKDKLFDYILTTEAFHHFPDPEKALLEMKRVLKDDGKIILIDINFGPGISYLFHKIEPGNKKIYSKKQFRQLFKATGLHLIEQKRIGVVAIYNLLENFVG